MVRSVSVVGLNHRPAPVETRERLALTNGQHRVLLRELLSVVGVEEAVVLSTCNRVEVIACHEAGPRAVETLARPLLALGGMRLEECAPMLYEHVDREAVRHVFRVASSLDSMIVGEPQILGQMKRQFDESGEADAVGPVLRRVFQKSFSVAKRVRNETGVAARTVSVASTAVDLASRIFESLDGRVVLLIGAGETGEVAARHLLAAGASQIMVANRTFENAVQLARSFSGTAIPIERLSTYLALADLVIGASGGGEVLACEEVRSLMRERKQRPVFFIDLGVPRNFDAAINEIDNAYLYDVDDLEAVVEDNVGEREHEALRGEAIVESEVDVFWRWFEKLEVMPTIAELRDYGECIRAEELARTLTRMEGLGPGDRERLEQMTRAIVKKILHEPTARLRQEESPAEESRLLTAARRLFGLGEDG